MSDVSTAPNGAWEAVIPRIIRVLQSILALFQTRVDIAKQDAQAAVRNMVVGAVLCAVAVLLLAIALPIAVVTLVLVLATWLPPWAATGIVFVVLLLLAGGLFFAARRRFARRWSGKLLDGLREDWKAIREQLEGHP